MSLGSGVIDARQRTGQVLGRAAPHNGGYGGGYSGHNDGGGYDGNYDGDDGGGGYDGDDGGGYDGDNGGGYGGDNGGGGYGGRDDGHDGGGFNNAEDRDATQLRHKPCDLTSGRPQFRDARNYHNRHHGRNSVHRLEKKESADRRATADNSRSTTHGHQHRRVSQAQPVAGNAAQNGWLGQPSRLQNSNHRNQQQSSYRDQQYNGKQLREEPDQCQTSLLAEQLREQNKELYRLLAQVRTELATCKHDLAKCRSELAPCMQHAIDLRKQVFYERQQKHRALTEIQRLYSLGNASATTPATRHGYDHKRINTKPSRYTPDCRSNNGRGSNDSNNGRGSNDSNNGRGNNDNDDARGDNDNDDARGDNDNDDAGDDDARRADDDRGDYGRGDYERDTNDGDCIDKATKNCSKTYQDSKDQSKDHSTDQHDLSAAAAEDGGGDENENSCDNNDDHTSTGQSSDSDKMSSRQTGRQHSRKRRFQDISSLSSTSATPATLSKAPASS